MQSLLACFVSTDTAQRIGIQRHRYVFASRNTALTKGGASPLPLSHTSSLVPHAWVSVAPDSVGELVAANTRNLLRGRNRPVDSPPPPMTVSLRCATLSQ